jgi:hypothetical protein
VHAALLTTNRAKVGAFVEWAWDYLGKTRSDPVLDRHDQANINWNDDDEPMQTVSAAKG